MKKKILLILLVLVLLPLISKAGKKQPLLKLPGKYKKWLKEEVNYIITPIEKETFLKLTNNEERELFIKAFWKHRDPTPGTPRNEFKEEHYRRIEYANNWFGRESPTPGWRTDRGRIYILLGKPSSVDKILGDSELYPTIIWFYQGKSKLGLPNSFNVVFYKKDGYSEYELYSPIKDGPQSLLRDYNGDPTNYLNAYYKVLKIEPSVAKTSLSLIPNERMDYLNPSMASEILVNTRIPAIPFKMVNSEYAKNFLKFKGIVEVDYSLNYIPNKNTVKVFKNLTNLFFVNYSIEPERLSLEKYGNIYKTQFFVIGNVFNKSNKVIFHFEKKIPLELYENEYSNVKNKKFSLQDSFPVIPGKYHLNILLKNGASKEFTSFDQDIIIDDSKKISDLIVANKIKKQNKHNIIFPFMLSDTKFRISSDNSFLSDEVLFLAFHLNNIDNNENYSLIYIIKNRKGEKVFSLKEKLHPDTFNNIIKRFSLKKYQPGFFTIEVLLSDNKKIIDKQSENFYITPLLGIKRSWILSKPIITDKSVNYDILANQYFRNNNYKKANEYFNKAVSLNKTHPKLTLDYGKFLLKLKNNKKIIELTKPFLKTNFRKSFILITAFAYHGLKNYKKAIKFYEEFLHNIGKTPDILNLAAECYLRINNLNKAMIYYRESLKLEREQPIIKQIMEKLTKKRR
jgi:GWxTD domain-containing protein